MLLSCGNGLGRTFLARGQHGVVDLAGDVSLYAAHDFGFCPAFSNAAGEVVARGSYQKHRQQQPAWASSTNSAISGVRRVATQASRTSLGGMSVIGAQATSERW